MYNAGRFHRQTGWSAQYSGRSLADLNLWMPSAVTQVRLQSLDLACERDARLLFEGLQLDLQGGTLLQVQGPNGSGKTSLLRLLAGLMQPAGGEVRLNGRPLATLAGELAAHLLWIGHAPGIKGLLTAEENLAWLCALHQPAEPAQITRALAQVGLRGFEDVPCHSLSAGQQRRVALARLHLPAPLLWILDEPFTALDAQGVAELETHLAAHCEAGGLVVLTTHHSLTRMPAGYRALDLGRRTP